MNSFLSSEMKISLEIQNMSKSDLEEKYFMQLNQFDRPWSAVMRLLKVVYVQRNSKLADSKYWRSTDVRADKLCSDYDEII